MPPARKISFRDENVESDFHPTETEIEEDYDNNDEQVSSYSSDEFENNNKLKYQHKDKAVLTSRLRRKMISRSKGGTFGDKKKKKRLYINSYSTSIDLQTLMDNVMLLDDDMWEFTCLADVLYLHQKQGVIRERSESHPDPYNHRNHHSYNNNNTESMTVRNRNRSGSLVDKDMSGSFSPNSKHQSAVPSPAVGVTTADLMDYNSQEVFVFEFGAVVAWGFSLQSVNLKNILDIIQKCTLKDEFSITEDEMGYIISAEVDDNQSARRGMVTIEDEVFTLHKHSTMKTRLSVSYAVAQSIIVSAFEESVEKKIEEYRYIPRRLAKEGQIKLRPSQITSMIGDLFKLKYDINLQSHILDIPDFFWETEDKTLIIYENISKYLELDFRVEVINKRLNMMKDLLEVVQAQHQSQYMFKLDWMIIWLLFLEVVVQVLGGGWLTYLKSHHEI